VNQRRSITGLIVAIITAILVWWASGDGGSADRADQQPPATSPASQSTAPSDQTDPTKPGNTTNTTPTDPTSGSIDPESGLPWVSADELPPEAAETLKEIDNGGPFEYDRDGVVFRNREGILPDHPEGYYHEYTVTTPGEHDRGARRIVTGQGGEFYYTSDHYESFARIAR
jgi:ribonuclease T1